MTDATGLTSRVEYETSAVVVVTDRGAAEFRYDLRGNVIGCTELGGGLYEYAYDDLDNLTSITDPLGGTTTRRYDPWGNLLAETTPLGSVTLTTYDHYGQIVSLTDPLGDTYTYRYTSSGQLQTTTDPLGRTRTNAYDAMGNPTVIIDDSGTTLATLTYSPTGTLSAVVLPSGYRESFDIASDGLVRRVSYQWQDPDDPNHVLVREMNRSHDAAGRLVAVVVNGVLLEAYEYDASGNIVWQQQAGGVASAARYDSRGLLTDVTYNDGSTVRLAYSATGDLLLVTSRYDPETGPPHTATAYSYDTGGRIIARKTVADPVLDVQPDEFGWPTVIVDSFGSIQSEDTYSYDTIGRPAGFVSPTGYSSTTYDADGRIIQERTPRGTWQYAYDAAGHLVQELDSSGREMRYGYDSLGRRMIQINPDGGISKQAYDLQGFIAEMTDQNGHSKWLSYNESGNLIAAGYSADDDPARSAGWEYGYTTLGTVSSLRDPLGRLTRFSYNADGRLVERVLPSGARSTWT